MFHDSESRGSNRTTQGNARDHWKPGRPTVNPANRIALPRTLPISPGIPLNLRTGRKERKQIERCVTATFQIAESMGFKGDFRKGEHY